MLRIKLNSGLALTFGVALLISACDRPTTSAEAPPRTAPAPTAAGDPAARESSAVVKTATAPLIAAVPAQPAAPKGNGAEPALTSMILAEVPHKLGAPVDLRYQFEGDVKTGRPVTLHLAAVPRVAGSNLTMSVKNEAGLNITAGSLNAQKVNVSTAYRQEVSMTKLAGGPSELHVLVTIEVPEGSAHSWFTIPLNSASTAGKQHSVKLE